MSGDVMMFPDTVEEFMEQYKMTDTEHIYSNGTDYVPIFRMRQWIEHQHAIDPVKHGKWMRTGAYPHRIYCSECYATYVRNEEWELWKNDEEGLPRNFCPNCGARMEAEG